MGSGMSQYFLVRNNMTVLINGEVYEIKDVTVDGVDKDQLEPVTSSLIDRTDYKGKDKTTEINVYFGNSGYSFPMPYNDVTVTVAWGKVDLDSQKTAAIQAIEEAYDGYSLTDYDEAGQAALENAMKDV